MADPLATAGGTWTTLLAIAGPHGLGLTDLLGLWAHFSVLSLLAVGGAITTAPDIQRYLVGEHGWISDAQFTASVGVAQAAPGPNILFVALLGWNVAGLAGLIACMSGILMPSSILAIQFSRYGQRRSDALWMRAFTAGLIPLTLGLLMATGWVLASPGSGSIGTWALVAAAALLNSRTRINPVWLIAAGGAAGALGWL